MGYTLHKFLMFEKLVFDISGLSQTIILKEKIDFSMTNKKYSLSFIAKCRRFVKRGKVKRKMEPEKKSSKKVKYEKRSLVGLVSG